MIRLLSLFIVLAIVPYAGATEKAAAPQPAPEMAKLKTFFEAPRTWNCKGSSTGPGAPAHKVLGAATIKMNPTGFWLEVDYKEKKSNENPMPFSVHENFGYDATAKAYSRIATDVLGGWCVSHAPASDEMKLAFTGECAMPVSGTKSPGSITFTKESTGIKVAVDGTGVDGKETAFLRLDCTK